MSVEHAHAEATAAAIKPPLIVDMDGALLRTDVLVEGVVGALFRNPLGLLSALWALRHGRAAFKRAVAACAVIDVETLPRRKELVDYIADQRASGRAVHCYSAADHATCNAVARSIGLFDAARGSEGRNLKGAAKAEAIRADFPDGFVYAGDSAADLDVWRHADAIVLAGAGPSVERRARSLGKPIEAAFGDKPSLRAWGEALRLHQWSKNVLIFVPLFLSGQFVHWESISKVVLAFVVLGVVASGSYMLNDLSDLAADRRHRSKRDRPFASGALPIAAGMVVAPGMIALGVAAAFFMAPMFGATMVAYLATTIAYSVRLKRVALLDVVLLAWLYTLRLLMGDAVLGAAGSSWLLTFSMFFFFSMSLAKRLVEVVQAGPGAAIAGRGYRREDEPVILAFGVGAALASVVILVLYLMEEAFPSGLYQASVWLWATPILLAMWTMRIWLLAHRGELDDDPVAFALDDKVSLAMGGVLGLAFLAAVFG